jgi:hypothetical protein
MATKEEVVLEELRKLRFEMIDISGFIDKLPDSRGKTTLSLVAGKLVSHLDDILDQAIYGKGG